MLTPARILWSSGGASAGVIEVDGLQLHNLIRHAHDPVLYLGKMVVLNGPQWLLDELGRGIEEARGHLHVVSRRLKLVPAAWGGGGVGGRWGALGGSG